MTAHIKRTVNLSINLHEPLKVSERGTDGGVSIDLNYGILLVGNQPSDFMAIRDAAERAIGMFPNTQKESV